MLYSRNDPQPQKAGHSAQAKWRLKGALRLVLVIQLREHQSNTNSVNNLHQLVLQTPAGEFRLNHTTCSCKWMWTLFNLLPFSGIIVYIHSFVTFILFVTYDTEMHGPHKPNTLLYPFFSEREDLKSHLFVCMHILKPPPPQNNWNVKVTYKGLSSTPSVWYANEGNHTQPWSANGVRSIITASDLH